MQTPVVLCWAPGTHEVLGIPTPPSLLPAVHIAFWNDSFLCLYPCHGPTISRIWGSPYNLGFTFTALHSGLLCLSATQTHTLSGLRAVWNHSARLHDPLNPVSFMPSKPVPCEWLLPKSAASSEWVLALLLLISFLCYDIAAMNATHGKVDFCERGYLFIWERISCSLGWYVTHQVDQACLDGTHRDPPAAASSMLGLKGVCNHTCPTYNAFQSFSPTTPLFPYPSPSNSMSCIFNISQIPIYTAHIHLVIF